MKEGAPRTHEFLKRDMLVSIDRRVMAVKAFKHAMDSVVLGEPFEDVEHKLQAGEENAFQLFPQQVHTDTQEFAKAAGQVYKIKRVKDHEAIGPHVRRELEGKLDRLGKNPDVILLYSLARAAKTLGSKYRVVLSATDEQRLRSMVDKTLWSSDPNRKPLDWSKVNNVIVEPFSISVIIDAQSFPSLFPSNWLGVHLRNSPFNFIRDLGEKHNKATIRHENVHNMFDGLEMGIRGAEDVLYSVRYFKKDTLDPQSSEYAYRQQSLQGDLRVAKVVNGSHEEFLAHLQNMNIQHSQLESRIESDTSHPPLSKRKQVRELNRYLSTAGSDMGDLTTELTNIMHESPDSWIGQTSRQFLSEVYSKWIQVVQSLYTGRLHAQINALIADDIHLFFVVTNPMNYHHISSYIQYKIETFLKSEDLLTPDSTTNS